MSAEHDTSPLKRRSSLLASVKAVAWSFVGLRRRSDLDRDVASLNPLHVVAVGFVGVFLFVVSLIVLVKWVVAK